MLQDLCTAGSKMVDSVAAIAHGETVQPQIDVGVRMFGADDYKEYLAKGWQ